MTVIRDRGPYAYAYEPAGGGDPLTLVLLHGTGGDHTSFIGLGRLVAPTAALIALKGDVSENGNLRFFRRFGEGRYDMDDLALRTRQLAGALPNILAGEPDVRDPRATRRRGAHASAAAL